MLEEPSAGVKVSHEAGYLLVWEHLSVYPGELQEVFGER